MTKKIYFIAILAVFICIGCGNDSCTTAHSYGASSFTKEIGDTCFKKLAGEYCHEDSSEEEVAKMVDKLQEYKFVFHKEECLNLKEKDGNGNHKIVKCPDFIPETLKMTKLAGCETYTVDPNTKCDSECPQIFFKTDNDYFKTIAYANYKPMRLHSQSIDGNVNFYNEDGDSTFSWSEKAEDGTEIEKTVSVEMTVVDPNAEEEPVPDTDTVPDEEIEVIDE